MTEVRAPIKILLVDDQALFRGAVRALLGTMDEVTLVGEAENSADAIRLTSELAPDVVLMDISLPGMNGLEATKHIHATQPDTPVLVLSGFADETTRVDALDAGAAGLIDKSRALEKLLPAIKAAAAR